MASVYMPRIADGELAQRLDRAGAVLIEGVKGCGKTETARRVAASEVRLDLGPRARETAAIAPGNVLEGEAPRLIDEWQIVPGIWNAVRRAVDERRTDGQFILPGSVTPADDETRHSGAGRFTRMRMRTMSLAETGVSNGQVSLTALLGLGDADASAEEPPPGAAPAGLDQMIEEVCRGGWPAGRCRTLRQSAQSVGDYANEVALADIRLPDGVRRDPVRASALLRALARNTGTAASVRTLARDSAASCAHLAETSAAAYLGALERLMVYEPLPAWSPILRSRARARVKPKHFFADPALSAALLDAGPDELRLDLKTFGFLFEGLAVRDLRAYGTACGADMFHFRDSNDLEVDIIASAGHQRWGAFEVKLGGASKAVDQGASTLLAFARNVDTQSVGHPRVLAVITAGGYSYRRPDGVTVIPLSMLGP